MSRPNESAHIRLTQTRDKGYWRDLLGNLWMPFTVHHLVDCELCGAAVFRGFVTVASPKRVLCYEHFELIRRGA